MPSQRVSARKTMATQITLVIPRFEVNLGDDQYVDQCLESFKTYAIIVPVEIRLPLKFLRALRVPNLSRTRMRVLALRIVSLHMGFPVVASFKELATHLALVRSFLRSSPLTLLLNTANTRQDRCAVVGSTASAFGIVKINWVASSFGPRPVCSLCTV